MVKPIITLLCVGDYAAKYFTSLQSDQDSGNFDPHFSEIVLFIRLLFRFWVLSTHYRQDHCTDFDA